MQPVAERKPHIPALDGVRGVAVAAVLLFHSDLLSGGYLGVDAFFVLSGFLITTLLLVEAEGTAGIDLLAFWGRRARRLLPALFLVLAAVGLYSAVLAEPTELSTIRHDAFATLAYVANWRFVFEGTDYWAMFHAPSPLQHTWSLAIEEQFYLVWPVVVLVVVRTRRTRGGGTPQSCARRVFLVASAAAGVGMVWSTWLWQSSHDGNRIYYGTDTRLPAIALGAALGAWLRWRGPVRSPRAHTIVSVGGVVGALVLAVAWVELDVGANLYGGGLVACSVAAAAVIASVTQPRPGGLARMLSVRPLVALGVISYGVYLWHWPIYVVIDAARTGLDGWALFAVRLPITLVVATLSFLLVERPVRRGWISARRLRLAAPALVAAMLGVVVVATAGAVEAGAPRPEPLRASLLRRQAARAEQAHATRVLVVGNSVASSLASEGLAKVATMPPLEVVDDGVYSCDFPPTVQVRALGDDGVTPIDCTESWDTAVRAFEPDIAVLVLGDVREQRYRFDDAWLSECDAKFAPHFHRALDAAATKLGSEGARVVLTTSAYSILLGGRSANAPVRAGTRCVNALIREYASGHPEVTLVDLHSFVCPHDDPCLRDIDGASLRRDGVHYQGRGARIVASWVLRQLDIAAAGTGAIAGAPMTAAPAGS